MINLKGGRLGYPELSAQLAKAMRHRGPDAHHEVRGRDFLLGANRLKITDLSDRANQPFTDPATGVSLVCNGAIYNARTLRVSRGRYVYRSRSDIEVLLPLYLELGRKMLPEIDGMFALAIWDPRHRTLILARDRAGEKPLFHARFGDEVWFTSEVQALLEHPELERTANRDAIKGYLLMGHVPEPHSMFEHIDRVPAASMITFDSVRHGTSRYWHPPAVAAVPRSARDQSRMLLEQLEKSVQLQTDTDVPVGIMLSGGLDSALITALALKGHRNGKIHTFSLGFEPRSYDESSEALKAAQSLGTDHVEIDVGFEELERALQTFLSHTAEPVADPAVLPTLILAERATQSVKVLLSGEGADELFGGYPTYLGHQLVAHWSSLPPDVRRAARSISRAWPASRGAVSWDFLLRRFLDGAELSPLERHLSWFGSGLYPEIVREGPRDAQNVESLDDVLRFDFHHYLRDNLLVKLDRATALFSLESRAPYLSAGVLDLALSLPHDYKIKGWQTKAVLKQAAAGQIPDWVLRRRKHGLSVPIAEWLNHEPLRERLDETFRAENLEDLGLDPKEVRRLVAAHRAGRANHAKPIWTLLLLLLWINQWM